MYKLHIFNGDGITPRFETTFDFGYSYYISNENGQEGLSFHIPSLKEEFIKENFMFPDTFKKSSSTYQCTSKVIYKCRTKEEMKNYLKGEIFKYNIIIGLSRFFKYFALPVLLFLITFLPLCHVCNVKSFGDYFTLFVGYLITGITPFLFGLSEIITELILSKI